MIPTRGIGGHGKFASRLPIDGMAIHLAEACHDLGYDTEINEDSAIRRTIILDFPSRSGKIVITTPNESDPTAFRYQYSLAQGVFEHHEERHQEDLRRAISRTIKKWESYRDRDAPDGAPLPHH